jgi:hypothetical protein
MDVAARDLGVRSQDCLGWFKRAVPNTGINESGTPCQNRMNHSYRVPAALLDRTDF